MIEMQPQFTGQKHSVVFQVATSTLPSMWFQSLSPVCTTLNSAMFGSVKILRPKIQKLPLRGNSWNSKTFERVAGIPPIWLAG